MASGSGNSKITCAGGKENLLGNAATLDLRLSMYLLLVNAVTRSLRLRLDALDAGSNSGLVAEVAALQGRNRILLGNGLLRVVELVDERRRLCATSSHNPKRLKIEKKTTHDLV